MALALILALITLQLGPVLFHLRLSICYSWPQHVRSTCVICRQFRKHRQNAEAQKRSYCMIFSLSTCVASELAAERLRSPLPSILLGLSITANQSYLCRGTLVTLTMVGQLSVRTTSFPDGRYKGTNRMRRTRKQIECVVENAIITSATREQIECADVAHSRCLPILVM